MALTSTSRRSGIAVEQENAKAPPPERVGVLFWAALKIAHVFAWVFIRTFYRVRVVGQENIPAKGPALLLCNHVSWVDGLVLYYNLPRPIRFMVFGGWFKKWPLSWLLRLGRCIPLDARAGPRELVKSLRYASECLQRGEVVCIFPEGGVSRSGFLMPFQRGYEQILKRCPAPIVPIGLEGLWGSIFSWRSGKLFWKWPPKLSRSVHIKVGEPLPTDSKPWELRQVVSKLMADCFILRNPRRRPVHRQFVLRACKWPFRSCLIDPNPNGKHLNFAMTLAGGICLARKLRPLLSDAPMTGLLLPTTVGAALANIAVALLRKTAVNLNYTASTEAIHSAIEQCQIKQIISARAFRQRFKVELPSNVQIIDLEDIRDQIGPASKVLTYVGVVCLPGWFVEHVWLGLGKHKSDDLATVIFSSGTTGDPKGVMLSHANIAANIDSMLHAIDPVPRDRLMDVLPFFHSFGYTVALWLPLIVGASAVCYPDPRQAKEIGEFIRKFKCNLFVTTPTFLRFIIRRCHKEDFATLRVLMTGAEKLPRSLAQEFAAKFGFEPLEGYGCTELSPVVAANVPDIKIADDYIQIGTKPGTIGRALTGVAVRIVDPNTRETLPPGQEGLLLVYGPNVMVGYLNRPEATGEVIRDGWYSTGDIAKMDEEGFLTITDRISRFSKVAGEMVPHQRLEDELHRILGTNDRVCAVCGVPDERKGERLVVLHTPLNGRTVKEVHDRLAESGLPNLWLPSPRSFFEVPELPILGSGKVDLARINKIAREKAAHVNE
jgi:acyl-[acyl-carrier-protein]-phospholipid O-acyltransferase/long-chain-fatty-acid--[acyl-carrier-protein] ligase